MELFHAVVIEFFILRHLFGGDKTPEEIADLFIKDNHEAFDIGCWFRISNDKRDTCSCSLASLLKHTRDELNKFARNLTAFRHLIDTKFNESWRKIEVVKHLLPERVGKGELTAKNFTNVVFPESSSSHSFKFDLQTLVDLKLAESVVEEITKKGPSINVLRLSNLELVLYRQDGHRLRRTGGRLRFTTFGPA